MSAYESDNSSIVGLVSCLPPRKILNSSFENRFSKEAISNSSKITGVFERRYTNDDICTSDLCYVAAKYLLNKLNWSPNDVDAVLFVSQTPDYILPATACVLQQKLNLKKNCLAFDVNLGCSGYPYGLYLASKLLDGLSIKKVLLLVGDTCSKFVDPRDPSTAMLFGDAGTATALEFEKGKQKLKFLMGTDGAGFQNLIIKKGGFRASSVVKHSDHALCQNQDNEISDTLFMDGSEIFNFTITTIPKLLKDFCRTFSLKLDDPHAYFFHQANEFIIKHISKKLKINPDKVPMTIHRLGNTSSASIPVTLIDWYHSRLKNPFHNLIFIGFGVGYSYGVCQWEGALQFSKEIEFERSLVESDFK